MEIKTYSIYSKIRNIKLCDISIFRHAPRCDIPENEIIALASVIRKNGLLTPLMVRRDIDHPKKYILVSGSRRFFALRYLRVKTVPVILLSLTDTEAELFNLIEDSYSKPLHFLEQASACVRLLKTGRLTRAELAEHLGISLTALDKSLSVCKLTEREKNFIKNHGFSIDFVGVFLMLPKEERESVINEIILNQLSEEQATNYIKEILTPKKKPLKSACISNDAVIMNSIERLAENLKNSGIEACARKITSPEQTEYALVIENKPKQMTLELIS